MAATDSCFALIGAHQHGEAVGLIKGKTRVPRQGEEQSRLSSASSTQQMWELLIRNRTAVLQSHAPRRWITSYRKVKQGAPTHQPNAWPLPHACAHPYNAGSGSGGEQLCP